MNEAQQDKTNAQTAIDALTDSLGLLLQTVTALEGRLTNSLKQENPTPGTEPDAVSEQQSPLAKQLWVFNEKLCYDVNRIQSLIERFDG